MRFESERGKSIGYSADTGAIDTLVPLLSGCDVAIAEATLDSYGDTPPEQRGHLTPEDAGRLATLAGVKRLVLTHLWQEQPDLSVVPRARKKFAGEILIATPGMTVDV
jgi:ribonuclease BN (tRNA processing enzyme)